MATRKGAKPPRKSPARKTTARKTTARQPVARKPVARPRSAPRGSKPAAPPAAAPEPLPQWLVDVLSTATLGESPPVSVPGGPSAHPDRPPVPPRPHGVAQAIGTALMGRPMVTPDMYRPAPVPEAGAELDLCAGCDVDCCTGHVIPVNCHDAWRIRHGLGIPYRDFLGLVPQDRSAPTHPVRMGTVRFTLVLRRRPDRSCGFLVRLGGERRCGVHAFRPDACRIFPFLPDVEQQAPRPAGDLLQLHPSHCPWRWPVTEERKERVLQDIRDNASHRVLDRETLSAWFWAVGVDKNVDNFYRFLEDELERRVLRPEEPSTYLTQLW
jgi:Fe-S-cluster containining protein